jgi:predicted ATPase
MKKYIITGTPGAGKTSIINQLSDMGYKTIEEAATYVIRQEQANGEVEPWHNTNFINKILTLQKARRQECEDEEITFFDRSEICTMALAKYLGSDLDKEQRQIIKESKLCYEKKVFFIKNLGFIENTEARKINFNEALKFEKLHIGTYLEQGFDLIRIEADSVGERVKKILNHIT